MTNQHPNTSQHNRTHNYTPYTRRGEENKAAHVDGGVGNSDSICAHACPHLHAPCSHHRR